MIPTTEPRITLLDIDIINRDHKRNYREEGSYQLPALIGDIASRGLMNAVRVEELTDGTIVPVQGFRRLDALFYLAHNNDPETSEPYIDPTTKKPFGKVKAHVYKGLTDAQRLALKFDHGQTRNLNKVEMFNAICDAFDANVSDKDVVRIARGLFEVYYPPKKEIEDNDIARLNYWKGALAPMKAVWKGPQVLRALWERKLRSEISWPTKGELNELVKLYEKAQAADKTNSINRDNPGTEFTDRLNQITTDKATAVANGERPKSSAMMNRAQVDKTKSVTDSRILKTSLDVILQVIPIERYAGLDKLMVSLESTMTDEQREMLDVIIGVPAPADLSDLHPTEDVAGTDTITDETIVSRVGA